MRGFFTKNLVILSVAVAGLMLFTIGGVLAYQTFEARIAAQEVQQANEAMDALLRVSTLLARERGLTSVALGGDLWPDIRPELERVQAEVNRSWRRGILRANELADRDSTASPLLKVQLRRAEDAWLALERARRWTWTHDAPPIDLQEWLDTSTAVIAAAADLREQLAIATSFDGGADDRYVNLSLKRSAWVISELAGQIRGILGFYAGSREPLPQHLRAQIHAKQTMITQTLDELFMLRDLPDLDGKLATALNEVAHALNQRFAQQVQAMLGAADTGNYPMDAREWYGTATESIDQAISLSEAASAHIAAESRQLVRARGLAMAGFALFALLSGTLAGLSLSRVRRNAMALFLQQELAETTLHSIGDAVITTDREGRIEYLNPVAEQLTGWTVAEAKGRPSEQVFQVENTLHASLVDPIDTCLREGCVVGLTDGHMLIRRDGRRIGIEDSAAPIRDRDATVVGCVVVFYDADTSRHPNHLLSYHATRDSLTGLINRREFDRRLSELLLRAREFGEHHVLAYIDLDQFKVVNDTCGHNAGDHMLRQLAFLIRKQTRAADTLARLGGDEFGLLLGSCHLQQAVERLDGLRQAIRAFRFSWEGKTFEIGMSIGVVPITATSGTSTELLSEADAACYAAKEKGRNRLQVYRANDAELGRRKVEMDWVAHLVEAMEKNRLALFCQPLKSLQPSQSDRTEILLRLRNPDGEIVLPNAFIPAAERYNLMPDIDRWVIRNACNMLSSYLQHNPKAIFQINLSALSLSKKDTSAFIRQTVAAAGISPNQICFEITETAAITSLDLAVGLMQEIAQEGFTFSLDDFGSGLSSFTYLKNLPVKQIKISGSFIHNLLGDPLDQAMVRSVVEIGHILGIAVCAECVEDKATISYLREIGADYAQGFAISHPVPLRDHIARASAVVGPGAA